MTKSKAARTQFLGTSELKETAYIYYQGRSCSQSQAAKYIGDHWMEATTGEYVKAEPPGILTIPIKRLWVYPEISEIDRHARFNLKSRLIHWFGGTVVKQNISANKKPTTLYTGEKETGSIYAYSVDASKSSLGQSTDIADHEKKHDALMKAHPTIKNKVVYGVSRGSATTFSAVATHKYENIKLCILEGVPSSLSQLFKYYFTRLIGKLLYNRLIAFLFLGRQHEIDKKSQARGYVDEFPNDIPLVIISSKKDKIVPHSSSIRLALRVAAKRINANKKGEAAAPVYFLQLDKSPHHNYMRDNKADSGRYQNFMHAVYKQHSLPYIEEFAQKGHIDLHTADLINGPLRAQVEQQDTFWQQQEDKKAKRGQIRNNAFEDLKSYKHKQADKPIDEQRRLLVAAQMPLFSKHRQFSVWNKTNTQAKIEGIAAKLSPG